MTLGEVRRLRAAALREGRLPSLTECPPTGCPVSSRAWSALGLRPIKRPPCPRTGVFGRVRGGSLSSPGQVAFVRGPRKRGGLPCPCGTFGAGRGRGGPSNPAPTAGLTPPPPILLASWVIKAVWVGESSGRCTKQDRMPDTPPEGRRVRVLSTYYIWEGTRHQTSFPRDTANGCAIR